VITNKHRPSQQQLTAARQPPRRPLSSPTRHPAPDAFGQLPVHHTRTRTPPTAYTISARLSATCMAQNMTAVILVYATTSSNNNEGQTTIENQLATYMLQLPNSTSASKMQAAKNNTVSRKLTAAS